LELGLGGVDPERVRSIVVTTPASSLAPLIHHRPRTGLEGKFSLEYGIAAALLDGRPGIDSFDDRAVGRPEAERLVQAVEVASTNGGTGLLDGEVEIEVTLADGQAVRAALATAPGAPDRPPSDQELRAKLELCAMSSADEIAALGWGSAGDYLRSRLTGGL
jgi:2-methylcitrate dehydratase PrpD